MHRRRWPAPVDLETVCESVAVTLADVYGFVPLAPIRLDVRPC